ncbi:MAG: alternative ribosome rescue aminoacyl-tRNA hydrolase ArfB [Gemmatimonadota bacterium]
MKAAPQPRPVFSIPENELEYQVSRSGGPGGQHVNKTSSRVEVWWNVATSPTLTGEQKARLLSKLAARLDSEGRVRVVSGATRSQLKNRKEVTARLERLVNAALVIPKLRKRTKPTRAAKERRLADKKAHAAKKQQRKRPTDD